ncbi:MAG: hypothetical protein CSA66_00860 [Proteobacteria bacterium]|nr:MAG: hypothetical protein CSA66_00860 [Pseudomonadota bacterium]
MPRARRALLVAPLLAVAALAWAPAPARARPTDGGLFAYQPDDELTFYDSEDGRVRVHYSEAGPSVALLTDDDDDGVPDFVAAVADAWARAYDHYTKELGLRPPLSEQEAGLGPVGGSYAFDIYLVDFGGSSDGHFDVDGCVGSPPRCAGALVLENDFVGYPYPSPSYAAELLVSHELFHGVQAAYRHDLPVWASEGMAVWGSAQIGDPGFNDLLGFAGAYLDSTWRPLYKPPTGPVPAFAYGTAIWFDFLATRHDEAIVTELLEARLVEDDVVTAMASVLEARGDALAEVWVDFCSWNLATGPLAGNLDGYAYAASLDGIMPESTTPTVDVEERFYPLSARFYGLNHGGGPLSFAVDAEAPELTFSLHPTNASWDPAEAIASWTGDEAAARALLEGQDLERGGYWLIVANTATSGSSAHVRVCVGDPALAEACVPEDVEPGPEAAAEEPAVADAPDVVEVDPEDDAGGADASAVDVGEAEPTLGGGGGCAGGASPGAPVAWLLLAGLLLAGRRRRALAALAALAGLAGGCAQGPEAGAARDLVIERLAVSGGYEDRETTAVVGFKVIGEGVGGTCSGSLIAPNLVLTARHCVAPTLGEAVGGGVVCTQTYFGAPYDPSTLLVSTRTLLLNDPWTYTVASEVWVPEGAGFCGLDMALVVLSEPISATEATPLIPRVDRLMAPTLGGSGETYDVVGYGSTDDDGSIAAPVRRRRDGLHVVCAAGQCPGYAVTAEEWTGNEGICKGDSGGPALDLDGRVIGVASRGSAGCTSPVYGSVGAWGDWIRDGARRAAEIGGYASPAWALGHPTHPDYNYPVGQPCDDGGACPSGLCERGVCTRLCSDEAVCPGGFECGDGLCLPPRVGFGEACVDDADCRSGACRDDACTQACDEAEPICPDGYICGSERALCEVAPAPQAMVEDGACAGGGAGAPQALLLLGLLGVAWRRPRWRRTW